VSTGDEFVMPPPPPVTSLPQQPAAAESFAVPVAPAGWLSYIRVQISFLAVATAGKKLIFTNYFIVCRV